MRLKPKAFDGFDDAANVLGRGGRVHDDQHAGAII
jgi:hypothetical protein